ncbi:hypothetical protein U1Q18_021313 [Sarracenia purpurea var. burkii]
MSTWKKRRGSGDGIGGPIDRANLEVLEAVLLLIELGRGLFLGSCPDGWDVFLGWIGFGGVFSDFGEGEGGYGQLGSDLMMGLGVVCMLAAVVVMGVVVVKAIAAAGYWLCCWLCGNLEMGFDFFRILMSFFIDLFGLREKSSRKLLSRVNLIIQLIILIKNVKI